MALEMSLMEGARVSLDHSLQVVKNYFVKAAVQQQEKPRKNFLFVGYCYPYSSECCLEEIAIVLELEN